MGGPWANASKGAYFVHAICQYFVRSTCWYWVHRSQFWYLIQTTLPHRRFCKYCSFQSISVTLRPTKTANIGITFTRRALVAAGRQRSMLVRNQCIVHIQAWGETRCCQERTCISASCQYAFQSIIVSEPEQWSICTFASWSTESTRLVEALHSLEHTSLSLSKKFEVLRTFFEGAVLCSTRHPPKRGEWEYGIEVCMWVHVSPDLVDDVLHSSHNR